MGSNLGILFGCAISKGRQNGHCWVDKIPTQYTPRVPWTEGQQMRRTIEMEHFWFLSNLRPSHLTGNIRCILVDNLLWQHLPRRGWKCKKDNYDSMQFRVCLLNNLTFPQLLKLTVSHWNSMIGVGASCSSSIYDEVPLESAHMLLEQRPNWLLTFLPLCVVVGLDWMPQETIIVVHHKHFSQLLHSNTEQVIGVGCWTKSTPLLFCLNITANNSTAKCIILFSFHHSEKITK